MFQLPHRCVGLFAISYEAWAVNLCLAIEVIPAHRQRSDH